MLRESKAALKERAEEICRRLLQEYPDATTALNWRTPWELLVATILSAQCTDEMVNRVTAPLFEKYPTVEDYAAADPAEFEQDIHATGFFRNKTKSILGAARAVLERFDGQVPGTMEDLLTLPGVARKTANCVLGNAFGANEGVVVDTHVARLSLRMGLTPQQKGKSLNTDRIERDLMELFPREHWTHLAHALIDHGRKICSARRALCDQCVVEELCLKRGVDGDGRKKR